MLKLELRLEGEDSGLKLLSVREATAADLVASVASTDFSIKRLRTTHHEIARLLAAGYRNGEIAALTSYSPSTISNLQNNPMFQELLAIYMEKREAEFSNMGAQILDVAELALNEIAERLENSPDEVKTSELREIARDMADRAGYSPLKKTANITLSAKDIEDLKQPAAAPLPVPALEIESVEIED